VIEITLSIGIRIKKIKQSMKNFQIVLVIYLAFSANLFAQIAPQKAINKTFVEAQYSDTFFKNKQIDSNFLTQTQGALLFFPELKNVKIKFRVKKTLVPLSARPRIWAVFQKPQNRQYLITISSKTIQQLEPILLKNLSFNAQIGVLGHEISHIAEFNEKKGRYFIKLLFMQLSKKAMDTFENNTDKRTIAHGLGYQLLSWSTEVRQNLKIKAWGGAEKKGVQERERYMSPSSITELLTY
jgi:hypothetical protein